MASLVQGVQKELMEIAFIASGKNLSTWEQFKRMDIFDFFRCFWIAHDDIIRQTKSLENG